jgi:hypothetical protein
MDAVTNWISRYISSCLGVQEQDPQRIWREITEWKKSQFTYYQVLCTYNPSILLPIAHILLTYWPGRDGIVGFSVIARHYGVPSLDPINQLMDGLNPEYEYLVQGDLNFDEIPEQRARALWMATETAHDVLYECSPSSSWEKQLVYSTVQKAEYLLKSEREWRNYRIAEVQIEPELRAIVRDFGGRI